VLIFEKGAPLNVAHYYAREDGAVKKPYALHHAFGTFRNI